MIYSQKEAPRVALFVTEFCLIFRHSIMLKAYQCSFEETSVKYFNSLYFDFEGVFSLLMSKYHATIKRVTYFQSFRLLYFLSSELWRVSVCALWYIYNN